jgi:hypothetical protein
MQKLEAVLPSEAGPTARPARPAGSGFSWWLLACAAAPVLAFCMVQPFLNMGFNDDFGFYHMALVLARTGRVAYELWTTPISLTHVFWGAAIIRVFGFSFFWLRVAILPFWVGCGVLMYLLGARIGLPPAWSALASLSTTLSPVAVPVGASFHTDITALAFALWAVYCAVRAAESVGLGRTSGWLGGALVAGALAGLTRDIYWMVAIWTVLAVTLLRWRERGVRTLGLLIAATAVAGALGSIRWHYSRPDAPPQDSQWKHWQGLGSLAEVAVYIGLTVVLISLPVMLSVLARVRLLRGRPAWIFPILLGAACSALLWWPRLFFPPWIGNVFTEYGSFYNNQLVIGLRPVVLQPLVRFGLGLLVLATAAAFPGALFQAAAQYRGRIWKALETRDPLIIFAVIALPCACGYAAVLVLRNPMFLGAGYNNLFDRYLLPVGAIAAVTAAAIAYRLRPQNWSIAGMAALAVMSAFGIANTHDQYAGTRARLDAAQWVVAHDVPRRLVSAGYEYDLWTQLEEKGIMSRNFGRKLPAPVWYEFATDAVIPCYYVVASPQPALNTVRQASYDAWLPPNRRTLFVQRPDGEFARTMSCPQIRGATE